MIENKSGLTFLLLLSRFTDYQILLNLYWFPFFFTLCVLCLFLLCICVCTNLSESHFNIRMFIWFIKTSQNARGKKVPSRVLKDTSPPPQQSLDGDGEVTEEWQAFFTTWRPLTCTLTPFLTAMLPAPDVCSASQLKLSFLTHKLTRGNKSRMQMFISINN